MASLSAEDWDAAVTYSAKVQKELCEPLERLVDIDEERMNRALVAMYRGEMAECVREIVYHALALQLDQIETLNRQERLLFRIKLFILKKKVKYGISNLFRRIRCVLSAMSEAWRGGDSDVGDAYSFRDEED